MRLKVLGAAGEVTGSSYLLECGGSRVIVDCGMFQGRDDEKKNREPFLFSAASIDAVLLTHAHLDHSGRIPLLVKEGFKGKVMTTLPTVELVRVLWHDSANLMKEEAEWKTKKNSRKGLAPVAPLYSVDDVDSAAKSLTAVGYDEKTGVAPGVSVRFRDAGHILGSAILEVWLEEDDKQVKIVFSGDPDRRIRSERTPAMFVRDYAVIESTYGDRAQNTGRARDTRRDHQRPEGQGEGSSPASSSIAQRILYELSS